jgi:ferredoxin
MGRDSPCEDGRGLHLFERSNKEIRVEGFWAIEHFLILSDIRALIFLNIHIILVYPMFRSLRRSIHVLVDGRFRVPCDPSESILSACGRSAVHIPAQCRTGLCGSCLVDARLSDKDDWTEVCRPIPRSFHYRNRLKLVFSLQLMEW